MSVEIYPRAFQSILQFATANKEFRSLFSRLEAALKQKEILKTTKKNLRKEMQNMRVDLRMARRRKAIRDLEIKQLQYLSDILNQTYNYLVQFMNLLDEEKVKKMISCGVLCKEQEVQQKIKKIEMQQKAELETKTQMEARFIVQQFRQFQRELMKAEEEHSNVSKEFAQMERNWKEKLDQATEQRNKKIVSLVELSKKISERKVSFGRKIDAGKTKAQVLPKKVEPVVLQSAMEFVNRYAEVNKITRKATAMDIIPDAPLRSILVMNRSMESSNEMEQTICSNKQVHFAPLPSPAHVSSTEPMMLNDLPVDMVDMSDLNSESSKLEDVTMSDSKYFSDRPIIETVQVLPTLSFSTPKAMNLFDQNLNFKNIFQSDDPMPIQDLQNVNNETETMNSNNSNNVSNSEDALNMMDFNFEKDFFNDQDSSPHGNYSYDL